MPSDDAHTHALLSGGLADSTWLGTHHEDTQLSRLTALIGFYTVPLANEAPPPMNFELTLWRIVVFILNTGTGSTDRIKRISMNTLGWVEKIFRHSFWCTFIVFSSFSDPWCCLAEAGQLLYDSVLGPAFQRGLRSYYHTNYTSIVDDDLTINQLGDGCCTIRNN